MNADSASQPDTDPIRLDQFLKIAGVAMTGGHAKVLIQSGEVTLNGEIETRRRKKLAVGDVIGVDDQEFTVKEL